MVGLHQCRTGCGHWWSLFILKFEHLCAIFSYIFEVFSALSEKGLIPKFAHLFAIFSYVFEESSVFSEKAPQRFLCVDLFNAQTDAAVAHMHSASAYIVTQDFAICALKVILAYSSYSLKGDALRSHIPGVR